jgi:tRNA dimethylallyltransferase
MMLTVPVIMGATATGKSALALALAEAAGREIISADSRQVYRGLRIGTAQPTPDERAAVRHHLIDFLALEERYSAQRFADEALALLRGNPAAPPLIVGGTGFYLRCLWEGLFELDADPGSLAIARESLEALETEELAAMLREEDPEAAERLHPRDRQRIVRALEVKRVTGVTLSEHHKRGRRAPVDIRWRRVLLRLDRDRLHQRIATRTRAMLAGGWMEEVEALLAGGADAESQGMQALGYPEIRALLAGKITRAEAEESIVVRTRQFARRQEIWFSKEACEAVVDPSEPGVSDRMRELLEI